MDSLQVLLAELGLAREQVVETRRLGDDLILVFNDGRELVIPGYFANGSELSDLELPGREDGTQALPDTVPDEPAETADGSESAETAPLLDPALAAGLEDQETGSVEEPAGQAGQAGGGSDFRTADIAPLAQPAPSLISETENTPARRFAPLLGTSQPAQEYEQLDELPEAAPLPAQTASLTGFAISGETAFSNTGNWVSNAGDVNGDGYDDLIVGASSSSVDGNQPGRAYVIFGKNDEAEIDLAAVASGEGGFAITGEAASDYAGSVVAVAGDVNGDSLSDLIVSAASNDANGFNAGRAYVIFGKTNGNQVALADIVTGNGGFAITGETSGDLAGFRVSGGGDINGDGIDDVIVSAYANDAGGTDAGRVYAVFGKADGAEVLLGDVAAGIGGFAITGENASDFAGQAVSSAGDVNGDGRDDILIGARQGIAGRAYIAFGKADGGELLLSDIAAGTGGFAIKSEINGSLFGDSLASAGDMNGDGLDDIIVGASNFNDGNGFTGKLYLIFGKTSGSEVLSSDIANGIGGFAVTGAPTDFGASYSVSGGGDINGDGIPDLITGAPFSNAAGNNAGRSYVIFGKTDGNEVLLTNIGGGDGGFAITGETSGDYAGYSVSRGGDINNDGLDDIIIGAFFNSAAGTYAGRAYAVFGKADGDEINLSGLIPDSAPATVTFTDGIIQSPDHLDIENLINTEPVLV